MTTTTATPLPATYAQLRATAYFALPLTSEQDINTHKTSFLGLARAICPRFSITDDNREAVADVFNWCIRLRQPQARLDPAKGLWLWGDVGTGKTVMLRTIVRFVNETWRRDQGEHVVMRYVTATRFCGRFADNGFKVFDNMPLCFDDLGTELVPSVFAGNKLNVMGYVIENIADADYVLPSVVTTRLNFKQLLLLYGAAVVDRIGATYNTVHLTGRTLRHSESVWEYIAKQD